MILTNIIGRKAATKKLLIHTSNIETLMGKNLQKASINVWVVFACLDEIARKKEQFQLSLLK